MLLFALSQIRIRARTFMVHLIVLFIALQQNQRALIIDVHGESGPVEQAEVIAAGETVGITANRGETTVHLPAGATELTIQRYGFTTRTVTVPADTERVAVELEAESVLKEEIIVTATRSNIRIEDEPLRVEVVDQDEIDEKAVMTPGDV